MSRKLYIPTEALDLATYHSLWDHAIIGVALVDSDGYFVRANPAFCRLLEYTQSELTDKTYQDITHPADRDFDTMEAKKVLDGESNVYDMKKRYITKTNRVVWVVLRVTPIKIDGEFMYYLSQVSELMELLPPRLPKDYPSTMDPPIGRLLIKWMSKNLFGIVTALLAATGIIVAEVLRNWRN